jgi:hypothetical protein
VWRAGLLLVACLAAAANADDLDDQRDAFGFKNKQTAEPPPDCSDGTQFGCTGATDPLDDIASPYTLSSFLPASYLMSLPTGDVSHDAVAHFALGASRDDFGVSIGGANGLENRWTIDGAPADGVRSFGAETRVPLAFLDGLRVGTGGFTARDRVGTGGTIDAILRRASATPTLEVHAWAGYTRPGRKFPIEALTFFPRRGEVDAGPQATVHAIASGPLGRAWYVAGLGAELSSLDITWRSGTARDVDGDGLFDGLPGVLAIDPVDEYGKRRVLWRVPFLLRGGIDRGVHSFDVSLVGSAGNDVFYLYDSTLQSAGVDGVSFVGDAIATWRGKWGTHTRARAQLAWHRAMRRESAADGAAADIPQLLSAYVPGDLADDPRLSAACSDDPATDPYPLVTNCPVPAGWFTSGGAGALVATTGDRPSLTADVAHRLGNNVIRVGATGEDTELTTTTRFTGGVQVRSLFPGQVSERRFVDPDEVCNADAGLPCPTIAESRISYRTRYTAAYVENTWNPSDAIAVDGGLRWELMWLGPAVHFSDELSPRLGASWDPLGGGKSRLWVSMGRTFAMLPAGLGSTVLERPRTVDRVLSPAGEGRAVDTGAVVQVAGGVEPVAQDELTAGAQVALARTFRATVWMQGRWLRRALDVTQTGFDNPGRDGSEPGTRQTGVVGAEIATAPTGQFVLRAGYIYGRTLGTWNGLFTATEPDTSINVVGRLPTDIGHRTYIEGQRSGTLGGLAVAVALRLTAASGRPRSVLADADDGIVQLLPRGSAGRNPMLTQADVRMSARWHELEVTLDVINAFDRHDATSIDEVYAAGAVRPIVNGSADDLVWLKRDDGSEATRRTTYAHATAFQSPLSVLLGIHQRF